MVIEEILAEMNLLEIGNIKAKLMVDKEMVLVIRVTQMSAKMVEIIIRIRNRIITMLEMMSKRTDNCSKKKYKEENKKDSADSLINVSKLIF